MTAITLEQAINESKVVKSERTKMQNLEKRLDDTIQELKAERQKASQAVIDGQSTDRATRKTVELSERVITLQGALKMQAAKIDQALETERVKLAASGQKRIETLFKKAEKEIDVMKAHLLGVEESYNVAADFYKQALTIRNQTGARSFSVTGLDISPVLHKVKQQINAVNVKKQKDV